MLKVSFERKGKGKKKKESLACLNKTKEKLGIQIDFFFECL